MRRILSLILAALSSMFSGVDFCVPREDNFLYSTNEVQTYYQVEQSTSDVQYKNLYGQVRGFDWGEAELCDTTRRQDDTRNGEWPTIKDIAGSGWEDAQNIFAPIVTNDYITLEKSTKDKLVWKIGKDKSKTEEESLSDVNICAPAAGTIDTSHYACNYGSMMTYKIEQLNGTTFLLKIEGAKCWYCCAKKKVPDDGRYTATTSDSMKGKTMSAGDVLCIGKEGTEITLSRLAS